MEGRPPDYLFGERMVTFNLVLYETSLACVSISPHGKKHHCFVFCSAGGSVLSPLALELYCAPQETQPGWSRASLRRAPQTYIDLWITQGKIKS